MSSPSSGSPPVEAAAAADQPTRAAGPRLIPGPRVRRASRLLPWHPYVGLDNLLRRTARLRYPALSSALAAVALAGCAALILQLVQRQTGTIGLLVGMGLAMLLWSLLTGLALTLF